MLVRKLQVHTAAFSNAKGQIISKEFLVSSISSKKRTKEFDFTNMIPQVDLFLLVFWRISKTPKNHFEIIWSLLTTAKVFILSNLRLSSNFRCFLQQYGKLLCYLRSVAPIGYTSIFLFSCWFCRIWKHRHCFLKSYKVESDQITI